MIVSVQRWCRGMVEIDVAIQGHKFGIDRSGQADGGGGGQG